MTEEPLPFIDTHPFIVALPEVADAYVVEENQKLAAAFAALNTDRVSYNFAVRGRRIIFGFENETDAIAFKLRF